VTATPRNGAVILTWPAASDPVGVTRYRIYRWTPSPLGSTYTADAVPIATVGATTSYTDATAVNGTTYSYLVRALDAATNVGPRSSTAVATPDGTPPPPATGLAATPGDGKVSLSWTKPSGSDLAGVKVVRRPGATAPSGPDDGTEVYNGSADSCTDAGLTNGQPYAYAAFAYDAAANYATASTAFATPNVPMKVALGTPSAPRRVGAQKSFRVTGSLSSQPASGLTVKIRCYQLVHRSWKLKKTVAARLAVAGTAGSYRAKVSLPSRGSWKLIAFVPRTATFAASTSRARKLTVR